MASDENRQIRRKISNFLANSPLPFQKFGNRKSTGKIVPQRRDRRISSDIVKPNLSLLDTSRWGDVGPGGGGGSGGRWIANSRSLGRSMSTVSPPDIFIEEDSSSDLSAEEHDRHDPSLLFINEVFKLRKADSTPNVPSDTRPLSPSMKSFKKCDSSASLSSTDSADLDERKRTISASIIKRRLNPSKNPSDVYSATECSDSFTCLFPDGTVEIAWAISGRKIREVLSPIFNKRSLSMHDYVIFLENSNSPLSYSLDSYPLANMTLRVQQDHYDATNEFTYSTTKESSPKTRPKIPDSFTNSRSLHDDMPDSPHNLSTGSLKRSASLDADDQNMIRRSHSDKSDRYDPEGADHSVHKAKSILELLERFKAYKPENMPVLEYTELSDVLSESILESLSQDETEQQQQHHIWELITTEYNYISRITMVVYTLLEALHKVKSENFLQSIDERNVFMNMEQVLQIHIEFWKTCIRPMIDEAVTEEKPLNPEHLTKPVGLFEERFNPHVEYCIRYVECLSYIRAKQKNNHFKDFITWCNTRLRDSFDRIELRNVLIDPIQRIQKYHLIVHNIVNSTTDDDLRTQLQEFYKKVKAFNDILNTRKKEKEEQKEIEQIKDRIESYQVLTTSVNNDVITKLLQRYNSFDLADPVPMLNTQRRFVSEHNCKISTALDNKDLKEINLFLFEDMLLITKMSKSSRKKCRIIKQPLALDRLRIEDLSDPTNTLFIYVNEFGSAIDVFIIHSSAAEIHKDMIKTIRTHKENFEQARERFLVDVDNNKQIHTCNCIPTVVLRHPPASSAAPTTTPPSLSSTASSAPSPGSSTLSVTNCNTSLSPTSSDQPRHQPCSITRSSSEHYPSHKRPNPDNGVNRVQSMPASNDKRTHMVDQSLVSASSCSSSASTSSASICGGGGGDANTSSSGLSLDKSMLSDIKETEKLQDLEEMEDTNSNNHNSLKIEDFKKYDDSYISDNLSRDVEEKLDVSNKAKIISDTVKNNDLNIIQNTST